MYLYQQLKMALFGVTGDKEPPKSWSPNNVKAVYITRNQILIVHHVSASKLVQLDMNKAFEDIKKNGRSGSLHNLLSRKQLSCLEEIYIDPIFSLYSGILNISEYVKSLISTASRLRSYGYIGKQDGSLVNLQEVYDKYYTARSNADGVYLYSLDETRSFEVKVTLVENQEWFKKYNLRPDIYPSDSKGGMLNQWLSNVERKESAKLNESKQKIQEDIRKQAVSNLVKADMLDLENIMYFRRLSHALHKDTVDSKFRKAILKSIYPYSLSTTLSLSKEEIEMAVQVFDKAQINKIKALLRTYKDFGAVSYNPTTIASTRDLVEKSELKEGIMNFREVLLKSIKNLSLTTDGLVQIKIAVSLSILQDRYKDLPNAVPLQTTGQSIDVVLRGMVDWADKAIHQGSSMWVLQLLKEVAGYSEKELRSSEL